MGLICTPFTGQNSRGGFSMRYSYEYKKKCIDMYRQGQWPETPEGIKKHTFKCYIREWVRIEKSNGLEVLKHKNFNKLWTPEEKLALVLQVIVGKSNKSVAFEAGISDGMLYKWVRKYKIMGYNGLVNNKRGRPAKEPQMKKESNPTLLYESEREELVRLRAENEYIKAENEVVKKEIALREEKQAALLKAKKQQSSKNFVKKDTN